MIKVPINLITEAGLDDFKKYSKAYTSTSDKNVLISEVEPPKRNEGVNHFEEERMLSILRGIKARDHIPPIEINELENDNKFKYRVQDGFHRFYASVALGFDCIPVVIKPYFNINDL
jgi:ParB-like chromosome segregation protein Spo0J